MNPLATPEFPHPQRYKSKPSRASRKRQADTDEILSGMYRELRGRGGVSRLEAAQRCGYSLQYATDLDARLARQGDLSKEQVEDGS